MSSRHEQPQDPQDQGGSGQGERPAAPPARRASRGERGDGAARRLLDSLSARSRGEGWDEPEGDLAKYRSRWRSRVRFVLQRIIFRGVVTANLRPSVVIDRRVRTVRGPYVVVANHSSHIDAPMVAQSLPWGQARFLSTGVGTDYWYTPVYKRIFVRLLFNAFFIDRDGSKKNSGTSRRLLRSGVPILVFPEGGRQRSGTLGRFNPGGAALAIGVGVPVIPAAMIGAHEAMPKGRNWPKPGRPPVRVVFGEPMLAHEGESAVAFTDRIRDRVQALYSEHHEEILGQDGPDKEGRA